MSVPAPLSGRPPIAIAGFKDVYHVPRVEGALAELQEQGASASEQLKSVYQRMIRVGGQRFTIKPAALPDIDALIDELPNFAEPLGSTRSTRPAAMPSPIRSDRSTPCWSKIRPASSSTSSPTCRSMRPT